MGEEMFRLRDRKGADLALGMTHEEIFTITAAELRSYRDLPQAWYQFQTKFRDEPRPKSGLIRVREFTMKDSYSFDLDEAGLDRSFDRHHRGLRADLRPARHPGHRRSRRPAARWAAPTRWSSCARPTPARTSCVRCPACGYAANVEKAVVGLAPVAAGEDARRAASAFDTPGARTIEDLAVGYGVPADRQIKTLVYVVDGELTLVLLRGDHDLVEQKLIDATRHRRRCGRPSPTRSGRRSARCPAASAPSASPSCRSSPTRRCAAAPA